MAAMDAFNFGGLLARRPPPPGFGPLDGARGAAAHMVPSSFELPVHHPVAPGLGSFWGGGAMRRVSENTNPFSFGLDLPPPLHAGFGAFSGGDAIHAPQMDPFTNGFLDHRLVPGHGPLGGGSAMHAATERTNPFSFGLDLHLPPPSNFRPFAGGHTVQTDPFALEFLDHHVPPSLGTFTGGGVAVHAEHNNPFSFGLDIGIPPLPGGGAVHTDQTDGDDRPQSNLFGPFSRAGMHKGPMGLDEYLRAIGVVPNPAVHDALYADGATLTLELPASCVPPEGHVQPAVEPPPVQLPVAAATAPASGGANLKNCKTLAAEPYDDDIDATLRAMEIDATALPSPDYLETTQSGRMSPETRASLVRWMGRFTGRYDLAPGTLHRAVSYADRFLSARSLADDVSCGHQLRLLGAAAVYAAAKYEDQGTAWRLDATEIAQYCGSATTSREVLATERRLLAALGYRLGAPTAHTFVDHFTRRYDDSGQQGEEDLAAVRRTAHRLAEISLLDYGLLKLRPSTVAAAAIFLARLTLKPSYGEMRRWNREFKELTGYKPSDLRHSVDSISSLMREHEQDCGFHVDIFPMFFEDPS
ncbi:hypothetical protein ACP70R_026679 [Stipagrostis hirtigluma subsp. patula]